MIKWAKFILVYLLAMLPLAPLIGYLLAVYEVRSIPAAYTMLVIFFWPFFALGVTLIREPHKPRTTP